MPKTTLERVRELFATAFAGRRRLLLDVLCVVLALAIGVAVAVASVHRTVEIGPLALRASVSAGFPGSTTFEVPPFGEVRFRSHWGPARLAVSVQSVDVARVRELLSEDTAAAMGDAAGDVASDAGAAAVTVSDALGIQLDEAVWDLVWLCLTVAAVVAAVAGVLLLAMRRSARVVVIGAATGLVLVLGSVGIAGATFETASLASPQFRGELTYVPQLWSVAATRLSSIAQLRSQVAKATQSIAAYYADPRSIVSGGGLSDTYRVLHVTDLHLDPVGAEFARGLARSYEASLVIDTGDIAIGGTSEETALLPSLVITSTPVVYVPGNHDSPAIAFALSAFPNYTVVTTSTITVDGLTILPVADPASASASIEPNKAQVQKATQAALRLAESRERSGLAPPEIIALHNPLAEKLLLDRAQVILSGHTHSARLYRHANTIRLNSGTTGGMPYDPRVTGKDRLPHGASILYYTETLPRQLVAIDAIEIGVDGTTSLDRTVVDESLLP